MKTLQLIAGTPAWHAHRATHFNASEVSAALGCSPHMSRTQLLHKLHTGVAPEVDSMTQRRFDDGHRFEALARPIAEEIIGDDLAPVVGTLGEMSASFDGLTLMADVAWECKSANEDLRAALPHEGRGSHAHNDAGRLPKHYRAQLEQQLLVSGAERTLFTACKCSEDGEVIEERHCWYSPDATLRAEIMGAWKQFAEDLAAYRPAQVTPAATGHAPESLPALRIEVTGMVTASNLDAFKGHALAVFKGINRTLATDTEFADAEKTVKWCGEVEDRLKAAKQHALSQTESIDALFRTIDEISAEARSVRLDLDKLVKARKEALRGEIVAGGIAALREHVAKLNQRVGQNYMPAIQADFAGVIKGLKSVASIQDAVDGELARCKILGNEIADKIQINMKALVALGDGAHFPDAAMLVLKAPDDCAAVIAARVAETERRLQEQRDRIRAEEAAKLQREQEARDREAARQAEAAAKPAPPPAAAPIAAPVSVATAPAANAPTVVPIRAASSPPTLKLGDINARLEHFATNEAGLAALGFPCTKVKGACLYHAADLPRILDSAIAHLRMVQDQCQRQAA